MSIIRDLEKCGLTNSSAYKSLTVDTTAPSEEERFIRQLQEEPIPCRIRSIFFEGGLKPAEIRAPADEVAAFYWAKVVCSDDDKMKIFQETKGQAQNKLWFQAKENRVSASISKPL